MQPIRVDGATSVFSIDQVMLHGEPCYYGSFGGSILTSLGYVDYIVLSTLDYERPLRTDYKFEQDRERIVRRSLTNPAVARGSSVRSG